MRETWLYTVDCSEIKLQWISFSLTFNRINIFQYRMYFYVRFACFVNLNRNKKMWYWSFKDHVKGGFHFPRNIDWNMVKISRSLLNNDLRRDIVIDFMLTWHKLSFLIGEFEVTIHIINSLGILCRCTIEIRKCSNCVMIHPLNSIATTKFARWKKFNLQSKEKHY